MAEPPNALWTLARDAWMKYRPRTQVVVSSVCVRRISQALIGAASFGVAATGCGGRLDGSASTGNGSGGFGLGGGERGGSGGTTIPTGGSGAVIGGAGGTGGFTVGGTGGTGGASGGAGGSTTIQPDPFWPDLSLSDFTPPVCENGNYRMTVGLNPAFTADYIAFRVAHAYQQLPDGGSTMSDLLDQTGTECSTSVYKSSCLDPLLNIGMYDMGVTLSESCGGPPYPCQHYLMWNAGDTHTYYTGIKEIATFLGAIDTPQEAMLLAYQGTFSGYWISCGANSGARVVPDGYEVLATQMVNDCPVVIDRVLLHVATDGTITELRRNVLSADGGCI